jgi:quinol monooxygenase YgiN
MDMYIFARFYARPGRGSDVESAIRAVIAPTRDEPGCLDIHAFRSIQDDRLFYIHSRWRDEAAFELHAGLPHTRHFLGLIETLIDQERDVTRTIRLA